MGVVFEESHSFEGFEVPDVEIVDKVANKVGRNNIMIKIHPRNPYNRISPKLCLSATNSQVFPVVR